MQSRYLVAILVMLLSSCRHSEGGSPTDAAGIKSVNSAEITEFALPEHPTELGNALKLQECKDFAEFIKITYRSYLTDVAVVPWAGGANYFKPHDSQTMPWFDWCALRISFESLDSLTSYVQTRAAQNMDPDRFDFMRDGVHYALEMTALIIPQPNLPKEYIFTSYDYSVCNPNAVNNYVHHSPDWSNILTFNGSVNRGYVGLSCGIDLTFGDANDYLKFLNYRKSRGLPLTFDVMTLSGVKYSLPHRIQSIGHATAVNGATISN